MFPFPKRRQIKELVEPAETAEEKLTDFTGSFSSISSGRVQMQYFLLFYFFIYRESDFEKLTKATPCEMQRTDLSQAILQLKALYIHNVLRFDFPSPPPAKNLTVALQLLFALNAIDENGELTDPLGVKMAEIPIHPFYSKMLLASGKIIDDTFENIYYLSMRNFPIFVIIIFREFKRKKKLFIHFRSISLFKRNINNIIVHSSRNNICETE